MSPQKETDIKNTLLSLLGIIIIIGIGVLISLNLPSNPQADSISIDTQQSRQEKIIGGEKDEHGCLVAAGYSWCEEKQKCLRTWEEECNQ